MSLSYNVLSLDLALWLSRIKHGLGKIIALSLFFACIGVLSTFLFPRKYVCRTSFLPTPMGSAGAADILSRLPAGLGIAPDLSAGVSNSPEIYPDIATSRRILLPVLFSSLPSTGKPVAETYRFSSLDSLRELDRVVAEMRDDLSVTINRANGLIELSFAHLDPRVAQSVVLMVLGEIEKYNSLTRQSQARLARRFLEGRMAEARSDLESAEANLAVFRSKNLRFANAPQLSLEERRLERRINLSEAVYQTLAQQFELARVNEARDTPSFTILEEPALPSRREGFGAVGRGVLGLLAGLALGVALALGGNLTRVEHARISRDAAAA